MMATTTVQCATVRRLRPMKPISGPSPFLRCLRLRFAGALRPSALAFVRFATTAFRVPRYAT